MARVVFDPQEFIQLHPHFDENKASESQLVQAFEAACLILDNSDSSPVPYDPSREIADRKTLLYLLVCHLMTLSLRAAGGQSGPLTSAAEGSVKATFSAPSISGKASDWYQQTSCGAAFWQAARPYLTGARYMASTKYHPWC